MTTGAFVRRAVVLQLDGAQYEPGGMAPAAAGPIVKLTLRVTAAHAVALATRARQADTSQGAYVAGLLDGNPPPPVPPSRADAIAALVASTDQLAALSKDMSALNRFLRQANAPGVNQFRQRLDDLFNEVMPTRRPRAGIALGRTGRRR